MPRYVYHCKGCNREFEVEKAMSEASRGENCPHCGVGGARVFTAPAIGGQAAAGWNDAPAPGGCTSCCPGGSCGLE